MKNLSLLNDNTTFKLNDTGTIIQFKASNEGQPVGITEGQSAVFRIRNEFGFLKSVNAHTNYDGYVFELDTSSLTDLVPDTYSVELLVKLDSDNELIFPDKGFIKFSISKNALDITGEQLPVMSLDSFKAELKNYVTNQTTQATSNIKNDFDTYVDNLTDSTITTATKASQDATNAINATKSINTGISLDRAKSYALVNTSSNLIVNSDMLVESEGTDPTTAWQSAYGWYYTDGTNPARTNTGNSIKLHKLNSSNSLFSTGVCAGNSGNNTIYSARLYYNNDTTVPVGSTVISIYLEYAYQPDFNNSQKILIGTVDSNSATSGYIEKDNMTVPANYNWVRMRIESNSDTGFFIWIKLPMLNKGTTALSYESSNNAGQRILKLENQLASIQKAQSIILTKMATIQSSINNEGSGS